MAHRVYISPSLQPANLYADGSGSEQGHMQAVGQRVVELLKQHPEFVVFANRPGMTLQQAVNESDNLAVHAHVAIHSNAGQTPGGDGSLALHYPGSASGERLAKALYEQVAPISPGKDDGIRAEAGLYELRETKAAACIIEVEFHDSAVLAAWIGEHHEELAQAIYRGICNYFGVAPIKAEAVKQVKVHAGDKVYTGELRGNKTLVHVRVLEEFGLKVHWDGKEVWVTGAAAAPQQKLPMLERRTEYDVITCYPEQLEVAMAKGKLPTSRNGVNGGFTDDYLNPLGVVIIDGKTVATRVARVPIRPCLVITKNNRARIAYLTGTQEEATFIKYALGGAPTLLRYDTVKGVIHYPEVGTDEGVQSDIIDLIRPRTAVGLTPTGLVKLITTDPVSIRQLAEIAREAGCTEAVALDGGGSTAMVWDGKVIRGNQRAVSTAILIRGMI